jgi:hypothetical protein
MAIWKRKTPNSESFETRSLPTLTHCFPRNFTFYVAHPIRSIREQAAQRSIQTHPRNHGDGLPSGRFSFLAIERREGTPSPNAADGNKAKFCRHT